VLSLAAYSSGVERGDAVAPRKLMRWYNPRLDTFEWRGVPNTDEEALSLLDGYVGAETHAAVYEEWRRLGAGIMSALIRAGEMAKQEGGE
jgi:hypothetical protein